VQLLDRSLTEEIVYSPKEISGNRGCVRLYRTRFMLDELGNLQSEGHGIANLETMLSIGLGQEQQFSATSCILKRYTDLFYMNQSVIQILSKDMD